MNLQSNTSLKISYYTMKVIHCFVCIPLFNEGKPVSTKFKRIQNHVRSHKILSIIKQLQKANKHLRLKFLKIFKLTVFGPSLKYKRFCKMYLFIKYLKVTELLNRIEDVNNLSRKF